MRTPDRPLPSYASARITLVVDCVGVSLLVLLAFLQILPPDYGSDAAVWSGVFAIISGAAAWSLLGRVSTASCSAVILLALILSYYVFAGPAYVWPLHLLLPLSVTFMIVLRVDSAEVSNWLRRGTYSWVGFTWSFMAGLVIASALIAWLYFFSPDLSLATAMLPRSLGTLVMAGIGFSIGNALLEEIVWRGVLLQWLVEKFPPTIAVVIQALSFGAAHWNGFPSGLTGAILAVIFGSCLGLAALRLRGIFAVTATHAIVDAVVFTILALSIP